MNILRRITGAVLYALILAGAGALAPAGAQVNTGDPNVVVDFSVLEDAGYGAAPVYAPAAPVYMPASPTGRRLLMPGPKNPVSLLHVPPVRGKKAKSSRKAKAAARPAMPKKAALAPPPAKAPKKPPMTVSAIPAPVRTPPPPPTMAETAAKTKKTPAARPGEKPKAQQKAALPPAGTHLAPGRAMQIVFKSTASKLPDTAKAGLKTLAAKLKGQPALRLQLMAYAGGESLSSGKARRLSLSRALSVRSFLIENGVRSTRIDVRALGNKTAEEPSNRVDVTVAER
jgi:outer membrane protein OmpA-like peptidoglycan-associated protein